MFSRDLRPKLSSSCAILPDVRDGYELVRDDNNDIDWALYGYPSNSKNVETIQTGSGGWEELISNFNEREVFYGFARVTDPQSNRTKFVFVTWVGIRVSVIRRARVSIHQTTIKRDMPGISVSIYGNTLDEIGMDLVLSKLRSAGGASYDFGKRGIKHSAPYFRQVSKRSPRPKEEPKEDTSVDEKEDSIDEEEEQEEGGSGVVEICKTGKLESGIGAEQGTRPSMEDRHKVIPAMEGHEDYAWFGVFDGHGGDEAAVFVGDRLHEIIAEEFDEEDVRGSMTTALANVDDEFMEECELNMYESGTTVVISIVNLKKKMILTTNLGDSRAIMSEGGTAVALSEDHKPKNPEEIKRIEAAGFSVKNGRVNGTHAVSRSIGDVELKANFQLEPHQQAISNVPDFIEKPITDKSEFLVVACDGLFDVMSNQEVVDWVRTRMTKPGFDLTAMASELAKHAVKIGSTDNVSVCIVLLP